MKLDLFETSIFCLRPLVIPAPRSHDVMRSDHNMTLGFSQVGSSLANCLRIALAP